MANVARLGVVMGLDTAEFTAGIEAAKKTLEDFKDRILELGSGAAFLEMTNKALEFADSIVKTAKANDVTTASVLELSRALEESGGSAEMTSQIYSGFNQKVETAALGSAKAQESFARLGVSLKDIQTLSSQDLFAKTVEGLAKINDSVTRNGLAFQTLGKAAKGMDIVGLNENLKEAKGSMDQYAGAIEQAHGLSLKLQKDSSDIGLEFTKSVIPALDSIYDGLRKLETPLKGFIQLVGVFVDVLATVFHTAEMGIVELVDVMETAGITIADLLTGDISKAKKDWKGGLDEMSSDYAKYEEQLQKLMHPPEAKKAEGSDTANRSILAVNASKLNSAKALTDEYKRHADLTLQMALQARDLLTLTKDQQSVQVAINKVIDDNAKAVDNIDKLMAAAKGTQGGDDLIKEYQKQKDAILNLRDTYVEATRQEVQDTIDFQRTFEFGWNKAFNQFKEDAGNNAKITEDMFNSTLGSMNSAIDTFVTTGKLSFSSLALSILQDMEKIIIKAYLMKAITGMFGGASTTDITGSSFSGNSAFSLAGRASGGAVTGGSPYLVGENGPELMIPSSAGTVIPNNSLSGSMSGMGSNGPTYNGPYIANMSAIDTQSAMQFISKNQNSIWAANQSAQRSLPQSR